MSELQRNATVADSAGDPWIAKPWRRYGVSRTTWWTWRRRGIAPEGVRLGPNVWRWPLSRLLAWEQERSTTKPAA